MQLDRDRTADGSGAISHFSNVRLTAGSVRENGIVPIDNESNTDQGDERVVSNASNENAVVAPAVDAADSALARALHELDAQRARAASLQAEVDALKMQLDESRASLVRLQQQQRRVVVPSEIAAADLQFGAKVEIGRGAAAVVYAATLHGESVAVKEMRGSAADVGQAAAQELAIAKRLIGHANIVTTFGVVQAADRLCLVMERLPQTLSDALYGARDKAARQMTLLQRLTIAHGVASGLRFCHAQAPPVLHRDLKPGNVLLSDDLRTIKLCDFGSARTLADASSMTLGVGTAQYMAPEALIPPPDGGGAVRRHQFNTSTKIDVYSFAVLLWELFSGAKPFASLQAAQVPMAVCHRRARPSPDPKSMPAEIAALMKRCWAHKPNNRPPMAVAIGPLAQALVRADDRHAAEARKECIVCLDAPRSTALSPCGHVCSCADCADGLRECPICRQLIEARLKVFHV